jgi:acetyltransferase-like isoleucine patch superfamily enzyme
LLEAVVHQIDNAMQRGTLRRALAVRGSRVSLGNRVQINGIERIAFGDDVVIADFASLSAAAEDGPQRAGEIRLADRVRIGRNTRIGAPPNCVLSIGEGTSFYQGVVLIGDIQIGAECVISGNIFIGSEDHRTRKEATWLIRDQDALPLRAGDTRPVRIGDDVWIGWGAVIRPGVTIGRGAVVGANSVVTKPVYPYTIVAGVPAGVIGKRLDFLPPTSLDPMNDESLPYLYSGFKLRQADLAISRRRGVVWVRRHSELMLNAKDGGTLRIDGILPDDTRSTTFCVKYGEGHERSFEIDRSPFSLDVAIAAPEPTRAIHPSGTLFKIVVPGARALAWGLQSIRFF